MKKTIFSLAAAGSFGISLLLIPLRSFAETKGAGSTLARDLMQRWVTDFGKQAVSYTPVGSSGGLKQLSEKSVQFAVSDRPLAPVQLQQQSLRQVPLAATGVVVVANLPSLAGKTLKLNGATLADIYSGTITTWDHINIKSINPGVALPAIPIKPMWRSDGSGQTWAFTTYLSRYHGAWSRKYGADNRVAFSVGAGHAGGAAVLAAVKTTLGAIGYDVSGEAAKSGLVVAELQNAMSRYVAPTRASIGEALARASWTTTSSVFVPPNSADLDASPGENAWPISVVTYAVVPAEDTGAAMSFLAAAIAQGDKDAVEASFVPLPAEIKEVARKTLASITTPPAETSKKKTK